MKFKADEIASVIQREIEDFRGQIETSEVGRVLEVGDGIARCYGLSSAMAGEMVEFQNGTRGQVFNLEENSVGVIILGDYLGIADRKTGKTAVALDAIINQKGGDVVCVYVACGQRASSVAGVVEILRKYGAMDYTIVVSATASDPAPLQYIAPYAGCAMAEYF